MKHRRFSLDSSVPLEGGGGFLGGRWGSRGRRSSEGRKSLEETQPDVPELGGSLSRSSSLRSHTIEEESLDHGGRDGVITNNSFVKHNKTFHKLFQDIPETESLTHVFTCALQKEMLYHGKLFVSNNYVCFHSSVLLKETKVVLHVSSIKEVKKQKAALSMLSIYTTEGGKLSFVSLRNREVCYKLLQSVCIHTQVRSPGSSPCVSSGENGLDHDIDAMSSPSSLEDGAEHWLIRHSSHPTGQANQVHRKRSSTPEGSISGDQDEPITDEKGEEETADSWAWNKVFSPPREIIDLSTLIYISLLLVVLLLLTSWYIGLRISALEQQLTFLGARSELSLPSTE